MLTILVVNNPTDTAVAAELSLRQAVVQANTDAAAGTSDTITFDPSLGSHTITLTQGQLELSGAGAGTITIDGSSPSTPLTISGGGAGRVFQIDSGVTVVLTNLNLQDGLVAGSVNGGAILNSGTLTISNTTLSGNSVAAHGGAIENQGTMTLVNDVFANDSATSFANVNNPSGGAIDNEGTGMTASDCTFSGDTAQYGGSILSGSALTLADCTFSADTASFGGAIYGYNSAAAFTASGCFFSGDSAGNNGGAIEFATSGAKTLTGCTFSGNTASGSSGGAIYNYENYQDPLTLNGCALSGNTCGDVGGGIENYYGSLNVNNSTFSANTATNGGGGINTENGGNAGNPGATTISNSTFYANGSFYGGAISNSSPLTLLNVTIYDNSGFEAGGIGIGGDSLLVVQNSIISGNTSNHYSDSNGDIIGAITSDLGNNLLGTDDDNSSNDPTPGPGDIFSDAPEVAALGNYGGPTQTLALLSGSPAIAAGNASAANLPATDQRGLPRLNGRQSSISGRFRHRPRAWSSQPSARRCSPPP